MGSVSMAIRFAYKRNTIALTSADLYIEVAKKVTKELQKLAHSFIKNLSEDYLCSAQITLDTLLELHVFRQESLSPAEQFVKELNSLENNSSDDNYAMQIYNEKLQTFDGEKKKMIAIALKAYWQRINKWEGGSDKQRQKVMTVKAILGES